VSRSGYCLRVSGGRISLWEAQRGRRVVGRFPFGVESGCFVTLGAERGFKGERMNGFFFFQFFIEPIRYR